MSKVVIIGGGASGMMAAIAAAENGNEVHVYEKNEKLGKKLFITGKGRCNITNACDVETLLSNVVTNNKFLYSAFYAFDSYAMIDLLESCGLKTKIERGNRVFPKSDKSSDVIAVLHNRMKKLGVKIHLNSQVRDILIEGGCCKGIGLSKTDTIYADAVIVATGGLSYETTGATGDGYNFAKKAGHTIAELSPALVPFYTKETEVKDLQGLSLRNIEATIYSGREVLYQEFGEMLFTHYGVSGPVLLSASSYAAKIIKKQHLTLSIDLKPALSIEQLDARIVRDFEEAKNKQFKNVLSRLYPSKLIPVMIKRSTISPDKKINEISKEERRKLVLATKNLTFTLIGLRDYKEAIITQGGVSIKGICPSTMESKNVKALYFVGEVLDLDAVTGGFNLQIAWSTAYAAGKNIY